MSAIAHGLRDLVKSHDDDAGCPIWNMQSIVDCTNAWILLLLWLASVSAPSEIAPRELFDVDDVDQGVMVLQDGRVVRNGRILSPEANASGWYYVTFAWVSALLHDNDLSPDRLWCLPLYLRAFPNDLHFRHAFSHAMATIVHVVTSSVQTLAPPSIHGRLAAIIYRANRRAIFAQLASALLAVFFHYASPWFLLRLIRFLANSDAQAMPWYDGYVCCGMIFLCTMASTLIASQTLLFGQRWRISLTNMLHTSLLRHMLTSIDTPPTPSAAAHDDKTDAAASAALSSSNSTPLPSPLQIRTDVDRLADLASHLHIFYTCPLEIIAGIAFLYYLLGTAFFVGLVAMTVVLPLTHLFSRRLAQVQQQLQEAKYGRLQLIQTLLHGFNTFKLLAWENKWQQSIMSARRDELDQLVKVYWQNAVLGLIWFVTPVLVTTISFAWYILVDKHTLDAGTAFVSIVLYGMLRDPLNVMPQAFLTYHDAKTSLEKIERFLSQESGQQSAVLANDDPNAMQGPDPATLYNVHHRSTKELTRVGFVRDDREDAGRVGARRALAIPSFDFPIAGVSLITGPAGAGKSLLLRLQLGNLPPAPWVFRGHVMLPTRYATPNHDTILRDPDSGLDLLKVAYIPQIPWLLTDHLSTIRSQIIFMDPWLPQKYEQVLQKCELHDHLAPLTLGDRTLTHDIHLSDVFKAKIALARALYSDAKTVLVDDVFSALPEPIGRRLLGRVAQAEFWGTQRTVILATRCALGSWAQHARLIVDVTTLLLHHPLQLIDDPAVIQQRCTQEEADAKNHAIDQQTEAADAADDTDDDENSDMDHDSVLSQDRTHHTTSQCASLRLYMALNGSYFFWFALLTLCLFARLSALAETYWLKIWTTASVHDSLALDIDTSELTVQQYIGIYLGICLVTMSINFVAKLVQYRGSLRASRRLFADLMRSVLRSRWQVVPRMQSTLMDCFGKDLDAVDHQLSLHVSFMVQSATAMAGVLLAISVFVPMFLPVAVVASLLYAFCGYHYLRTSCTLKTMQTATQNMVHGIYVDVVDGLTTFRAFGKQQSFMGLVYQVLDDAIRPSYFLWMLNRWLFIRVEAIGASLSLFLGVYFVWQRNSVDAGLAAMVLTLAASLLEYAYWMLRQATALDQQLHAFHQITSVIHHTPQHDPREQDNRTTMSAPAQWPMSASLDVHDLSYVAPQGRVALDLVSLQVQTGETLLLLGNHEPLALARCLTRIAAHQQGSIKLDGIDIAGICPQDLRSRITFISQESDLIGDTVRSNLDPFGEYHDHAIWQALHRVQLAFANESVAEGLIYSLDMPLDTLPLMALDRQRLALARAILIGRTKLLIVHLGTDDPVLAQVLHDEFMHSTILLLAKPTHQPSHIYVDRAIRFKHGRIDV
ncbi:ABC transporter type 1, transmembrane domain-containing protein [Gongronella butleri]|nr:ABC transporter type 1, transmembrane domain-containing protein [Gongronella butleri]